MGNDSAVWNDNLVGVFCDLCIKEVDNDNRSHTHFNNEGWDNVISNFTKETGRNYTRQQLKNKWDALKEQWKLWKELKENDTGRGWDHKLQTVDASEEWWRSKIQINKEYANLRIKGIPPDFEVKLDKMFMGISATVVENGLSKKQCLRMFPQLSRVSHVIELNDPDVKEYAEVGSSNSKEWDTLEKEHRVYGLLAHACTSFTARDCILGAISASSTDNYPEESIHNTLDPRDVVARRGSYWSSKGQRDPAVPEMLTYKLVSDFVKITEINIHPFQAYFQLGLPIYSAGGVRFRMGRAKSPMDGEIDPMEESCHDDKFEWTYTSQVFPMAQENRLQTFKLPEPVLCIGGILQIELVGRVQRQEMDDLFYICVSHVQVKGHSLSPAFSVEVDVPSGLFVLKNNMQAKFHLHQQFMTLLSHFESP